MKIYRIEHKDSKLGPFHHDDQIAFTRRAIHGNTRIFPDIDAIPEVKKIIRAHKDCIFGFSSYEKCKEAISSFVVTRELGFVILEYDAEPLYIHGPSGQVIFLRTDSPVIMPFNKRRYEHQR